MKLLQKIDGQTVTLDEQISCVSREINIRKHCYPHWIETGIMTKDKSDREIAAMKAVLQTLEDVKAEHEDKGIGL